MKRIATFSKVAAEFRKSNQVCGQAVRYSTASVYFHFDLFHSIQDGGKLVFTAERKERAESPQCGTYNDGGSHRTLLPS
jgi:hypothetical protein